MELRDGNMVQKACNESKPAIMSPESVLGADSIIQAKCENGLHVYINVLNVKF